MDEYSWQFLRQLVEEGNFVLTITLQEGYKKPSVSASLIYLKAYTMIKTEGSSEDYYGCIICWFLGVKAVHKELFFYLKEKTKGDTQLLQEVLLSPAVTNFTTLVPFKNLGEDVEKNYYVLEFSGTDDRNSDDILACDKKPGVDFRKMQIPSDVDDVVKDSFNYLTLQDRLLLKRAAILGLVFDQHVLEVVSYGLTSGQVSQTINNLLLKHIFTFACTSGVLLEKLPARDPFKHLECYNVCFCSKVAAKSVFRNSQVPHTHVGPYDLLRFRTKTFRLCILSYMTKEQYKNMRLEVLNELEMNGLYCITCRIKRSESVQMEMSMGDMRCAPLQMDLKQCACLEKRPVAYQRLATIHLAHGNQIQSTYYTKKRAQASNDIGYPIEASAMHSNLKYHDENYCFPNGSAVICHYFACILASSLPHRFHRAPAWPRIYCSLQPIPSQAQFMDEFVQALIYASHAESLLPAGPTDSSKETFGDDESFFDILVLKASILRTKANAAFILGNYYYAAFYIQQALLVRHGYDIFTWNLQPKKNLRTLLKDIHFFKPSRLPPPLAFYLEHISSVSNLTFMSNLEGRNKISRKDPSIHDFIVFVSAVKETKRKFKKLESNLIGICHQRLQKYDVTLNPLDIRYISAAYITVINMNVKKGTFVQS
ncbi:uncharacterized protein CEXT_586661 [Caerostris extrusa]|uniref:Uncharacterized protein n=1 Tax=Caerostris extrusa TaxID=172846 RepID=A0AAV4SXP4_CAEEX|nr:uncharacterized protein CEXT_586661 [Caerostris extrusa]